MRNAISFIFLVLSLFASWTHITLAVEIENQYRLGIGDRIKLTIFRHEDLSGEFVINDAGQLSLPLIKIVKAKSLTLTELEQSITSKLKPDYLINPRVSIEVLNYRPFYIIGEVKNPGSYPYVNGMTVINAIAMAGGYTYRAKKQEVLISSNNLAIKKRPAEPDSLVLPGDVIEIPERFF